MPLARPRKGDLDWPQAKAFAREVCRQMSADSPDRYLLNMAKDKRGGRIFLDYLRNDRTSTAVGPLSPASPRGSDRFHAADLAAGEAGLGPQGLQCADRPAVSWPGARPGRTTTPVPGPWRAIAKRLLAKAAA